MTLMYWHTMEEVKNEKDNRALVAMGLTMWANCSLEKPPVEFGEIMVEIGKRLNITPLPKEFSRLAKEILA